jgi:hypothetical protein
MRTYSRAWDCLLVAMILLYVLALIWFPMTMAIWTTTSFIATGIYVIVRLQLRRKKRFQRLLSSCLTVEVPAMAQNDAREPKVARHAMTPERARDTKEVNCPLTVRQC